MPVILDHTEKAWSRRRTKENGAGTYSRDIVKFQAPKWKGDQLISTCNVLYRVKNIRILRRKFKSFVQYLHTYPYVNPLGFVNRCRIIVKFKKILFITSYHSFHLLMKKKGLNSKWIPMAIDVEEVVKHKKLAIHKDRIIYFGNLYRDKVEMFSELKERCEKNGYQFDYICDGKFNGDQVISQSEAWSKISEYKYGIGVGRCALEMYALGLKVLIAGREFGGIVIDESEWKLQEKTNFNGRIITFDRDINTCLQCLDYSIQNPKVKNIREENHVFS